jgi:hypothetical protein
MSANSAVNAHKGRLVMAVPRTKSNRQHSPRAHTRLIVRVDLRGVTPPIWRRLDIQSNLTLDQVHAVIQAAFDWQNSHLHEFTNRKPGGGRD